MPTRIRLRRGTASQWAASNSVLAAGEIGVETSNPPRVKVGDGVTGWNALPYILGAQGPKGNTGPQGPQGIQGPQGTPGINGLNGLNGTNGKSILSGTTAPASGTGSDGDFYIDTEALVIWGPKTAGNWGIGTAISQSSRTPIMPPGNTSNVPMIPQPNGSPWPALWSTSEDSASGVQDWSNNQLRLVSPSVANQSSRAIANFSAQIEYSFSLSFPSIVDMTTIFAFRGSNDLNNRFELVFSPALNTIVLRRVDAGNPVSLGLSHSYTFTANELIGVIVRAVDGEISVRITRQGATPTVTPTLEYSTTLYKTNTYASFTCTSGAAAASRTVYLATFTTNTSPLSVDPNAHLAQSAFQQFTTGTTALDVNFINQTGTLTVASQVLRSSSASLGEAYYNYNINSSNHFVEAKLIIGASGTNVSAGITARHSVSTNTFYKLSTASGLTNIKLYRVVAGTATEIGTYTASLSVNTNRTLRLEVQGSSIRGYLDNNQIIAVVDTGIPTGTYGGASINPGSSTANASLDDFKVGALTGTPTSTDNVLFTTEFTTGANATDVGFTDMLPGVHGFEQPIIIDNQRVQVGNASSFRNANALCNTDMVSPDHWVEADLIIGSTVADQYCGVMARVSAPATGPSYSFYKWECHASSNSFRLETVVNNTVGIFTQVVPYNIQPNQTYRLRLEVVGDNIRGYVRGEKILDVRNSALTTQTRVGINVGRNDNTLASAWIDNFRAGNFLTGGPNGGGPGGNPTGISFSEQFSSGSTAADANLTPIRGGLLISGGSLRAANANEEIDAYHTRDLGSTNHFVEADFIIGAADTTTYCALNVRMATSGLTYYSVETSQNRSTLALLAVVGGAYFTLGSFPTGWELNSSHKVQLRCENTTIKVIVDGTEKLSVIDTRISNGTKVGVHMWTTNVNNIKIDNLVGASLGSSAVQSLTNPTNPTVPVTPGVGTGQFRTVGRHIVDPAGYKFIPIGMNGATAPTGTIPTSGWWSTNMTYMNGRASTFKNEWKSNFLRINTAYDPISGFSQQDFLNGIYAAADEYTALEVVVACSDHTWTADDPYNPPTYDTLMSNTFFKSLFEGWISRYKNNKYAWLYPLNEPWRSDNLSGWAATGTALYNRARELGWTGIFVWAMPQWQQGIHFVSTSTIFEDFLAGKTNTVLSWHNYSNGTYAQKSAWAQACNDKNIPVIIGECGQAPWQSPDEATRSALQWTYDNCWVYGFGMVQWVAAGNRNNVYALRAATGAGFYEDQYPLTDQGQKLMYLGNNKPMPQAITG